VFKRTALADTMTDALHARAVPDPTAGLAAELGIRAFYRAFERWAEPANERPLGDLAREALDELRAAAASLR
jgi:hypothetical protein